LQALATSQEINFLAFDEASARFDLSFSSKVQSEFSYVFHQFFSK
jgi:hypothetical protein